MGSGFGVQGLEEMRERRTSNPGGDPLQPVESSAPAPSAPEPRTLNPEPSAWRFTVRDNGIGIDPQFSARLFQIFHRLHTQDEYPGSGIGLAICKKIVERHGGKIGVDPAPGGGSLFHFTLPDAEKDPL